MKIIAVLVAFLLASAGAFAEENFEKGDPVHIEPDKAYFMVRIMPKGLDSGLVLVRVLSGEELQGAIERHQKDRDYKEEPNVVFVQGRYPFSEGADGIVLLTSAKPGRYILAGVAYGGMSETTRGAMNDCMCLGTVQFEAKAGTITDMGTVLMARDDQPSPFPELAGQVRNKRIDLAPLPLDLAVRPYTESMIIPDTLASFPREAAVYRARSAFPNYFGAPIDRLAPLPGVLDYDKDGHVVDLQAVK